MNICESKKINRRHLLRGAGSVALALPMLEAMGPTLGQRVLATEPTDVSPTRFVALCATLGFHGPHLFPSEPGTDYTLTPYLEKLGDNRDQFTVFSGLSHPQQQGNNGHASEMTWLTSAQRPGLAGFRNTISLDQLIAQHVGLQTRFPYLAVSTRGRSMSWTAGGVEIPGIASPAALFKNMFLSGDEKQVAAEIANLKRGRSILDTVGARAKVLQTQLGTPDQQKLDEYLTAVRELESRLQQSAQWVRKPKPSVDAQLPKDVADKNDAIAKQRLLYDMIVLAIQTDSTRTITYQLSGMNAVPIVPGVSSDWHGLSHHGKDPAKIDELKRIETAEFTVFNEFLNQLKSVTENGRPLLDHTAIMFGSNLGNASSHDWHNLPLIVAGGGFKHGSYVAHDEKNNTPLANLFVTMAQRMGVPIDQFGSSTAAGVRGLELT